MCVCVWWGGVRVEISEEEMRIQKGGHHSDSHLFSFSPITHMHARVHTHTRTASSASRPSQYFNANKETISAV